MSPSSYFPRKRSPYFKGKCLFISKENIFVFSRKMSLYLFSKENVSIFLFSVFCKENSYIIFNKNVSYFARKTLHLYFQGNWLCISQGKGLLYFATNWEYTCCSRKKFHSLKRFLAYSRHSYHDPQLKNLSQSCQQWFWPKISTSKVPNSKHPSALCWSHIEMKISKFDFKLSCTLKFLKYHKFSTLCLFFMNFYRNAAYNVHNHCTKMKCWISSDWTPFGPI